jgi:SAM-dependent methyltransferase
MSQRQRRKHNDAETQKKAWVRKRYGAIAAGARKGCCGESVTVAARPATVAERIGYSAEEVKAAPQGADLGLGCGNPLALESIAPGETVLDLGSGAGFDAFLAAARTGPTGRVIGVDMTPEMIEKARANAERAGCGNLEFRQGDIEALPIADESVDLVISNCVLNLVPNKRKAFHEIARVLKPGGRVAIADIVLDKPLPQALRGDADSYCSCVGGAAGRSQYLRALEAAGLADVRVVSEADAAALLAGDCATDVSALAGVVTSIHVTARKPG